MCEQHPKLFDFFDKSFVQLLQLPHRFLPCLLRHLIHMHKIAAWLHIYEATVWRETIAIRTLSQRWPWHLNVNRSTKPEPAWTCRLIFLCLAIICCTFCSSVPIAFDFLPVSTALPVESRVHVVVWVRCVQSHGHIDSGSLGKAMDIRVCLVNMEPSSIWPKVNPYTPSRRAVYALRAAS